MVDYMSTFSQETISRKSAIKGGPTLVEALYRHKNSLETIFRLLDKDNSGFITMDEFTEACDLISKHMDTTIPRDEMVD
ncbi:Serine/threonine-protein phosphatase with EF-hands 2, partial [Armadillidium vulgare]